MNTAYSGVMAAHSLGAWLPNPGNVAAYALDKLRLFMFMAFSALFLTGFEAFWTLTSIAFGFRSAFFLNFMLTRLVISCLWVTLD